MESTPSKNAHTLRALILLAALVIAPLAAYCAAADAQPPAVGTTAPTFTLQSESGSNVSLSDFAGKWVVLYFYPKDFTSGCTIEAHNFQRDLAKYQALDAVIVGVSVDTADSHKQFCAKEGLNFKLLADTDHVVSEKYGSLMTYQSMTLSQRNTFLIDPHGKIVKEFMKVDPRDHSENVLAALNELEGKAKS
jgi:peroxiredoxin Q/BCP